jgi:nicotinate-nucleotide--dimethylbenzimidazole phosphoribosyltransferase
MIDDSIIWAHLDGLAKPRRSLGKLESLAAKLAAVQQRLDPVTRPRRIVLFAGDHGVIAQGVSAWPAAVTASMVDTIAAGRATSNALAAAQDCDLRLVDVGVASPLAGNAPSWFRSARIADGTQDLATGPAMSIADFDAAWAVGADEAKRAADGGFAIVIAGEMGIGNTTPAACLTALLAGIPAYAAIGPGAGADDTIIANKRRVVAGAVAGLAARLNADPRAAIASVSGFEIIAMAGFFAAAAEANITILLDGFVATAAALVAERLRPGTKRAMIAAHRSAEPGHMAALNQLGLTPLLEWDMRLGEGTGALVALPLLDSAAALLSNVVSLSELGLGRAD